MSTRILAALLLVLAACSPTGSGSGGLGKCSLPDAGADAYYCTTVYADKGSLAPRTYTQVLVIANATSAADAEAQVKAAFKGGEVVLTMLYRFISTTCVQKGGLHDEPLAANICGEGDPVLVPDDAGADTCPGTPQGDPCQACAAASCCASWQGCQGDANCACWIDCIHGGGGTAACEDPAACGPKDLTTTGPLSGCLLTSCVTECGTAPPKPPGWRKP